MLEEVGEALHDAVMLIGCCIIPSLGMTRMVVV